MENFVATWRKEASKFYKNVDPQVVAEEILALGDNPKAKEVLEMARDPNKLTHKLIEWDDAKAAEKYRLDQAGRIISDLHIVEVGLNDKEQPQKISVPLRMFYHLEGEEGYRPITKIIQDEDLHKKLLMTAYSELKSFTVKYSNLTELSPVFEAIREIGKQLAS